MTQLLIRTGGVTTQAEWGLSAQSLLQVTKSCGVMTERYEPALDPDGWGYDPGRTAALSP